MSATYTPPPFEPSYDLELRWEALRSEGHPDGASTLEDALAAAYQLVDLDEWEIDGSGVDFIEALVACVEQVRAARGDGVVPAPAGYPDGVDEDDDES